MNDPWALGEQIYIHLTNIHLLRNDNTQRGHLTAVWQHGKHQQCAEINNFANFLINQEKKKKEECLPKTTALKFATRPSYIQRYFTSFSEPHHMLPSLAVVLSLATALAMTTSWEQSQQEHLP